MLFNFFNVYFVLAQTQPAISGVCAQITISKLLSDYNAVQADHI